MTTVPETRSRTSLLRQGRFPAVAERLRYPLAVYVASRVVYLLIAVLDTFLRHYPLATEFRNWDGKWYVLAAQHGYPHTLPTHYGGGPGGWSTLGFEPLYPLLMWLGSHVLPGGVEPAGMVISFILGGVATVEMALLAQRWWGQAASRRAILFFCFFPGTIVFSMVYSEALTLTLVGGALLCLEDRRWFWAGLLGGLATAVEPVAFAFIPAAIVVSLRELWLAGLRSHGGTRVIATWPTTRRNAAAQLRAAPHTLLSTVRTILLGLRDREARRSLWAPILSPCGAIGWAIFLWFWVGSPLANYKAQRIAWGEQSSILAVYIQAKTFVNEFVRWHGWSNINLNIPTGVIGAIFMVWAIGQMWKVRRGLNSPQLTSQGASLRTIGTGPSLGAWVWTIFVALLVITSDKTPPNPRMLICAFPILLAVAAPRTGRSQKILLGISMVLLIAMSIGSYAGGGLRP